MLDAFVRLIQDMQGAPWAAPAFMGSFAMGCMGLPITPFPIAGGVLFHFWPGVLYTWLGALAGTSMAFWTARRFARPWAMKMLGKRPLPKLLIHPDFTTLLVVRLVGMPPFHLVNYFCGLSRASFRAYFAATALGMLPWTIIMTFFADFLWDALLAGGPAGLKKAVYQKAGPLLLALALFGMLVGLSAFFGRKFMLQAEGSGKGSKE